MADVSGADQMFPLSKHMTEAEELLRDWAQWWLESDDAPVKMPKALHVRTAVYFVQKRITEGG